MASTYSNLKIELIGTGDQSGSWGVTTNTNLGTAIEEAIVGSADVTFASGDVTVTLTDTNITQTARNLRLNCTGTTGGSTRNLILGSGCQIEKPYLINNGCADSITVKNTTGTGITVPAGKSMWVYNNGTNVVDAVTHLSSLTLGSALPVASGGTNSTATPTAGGVAYGTGTAYAVTSAGTAGYVLTSGGASVPTWTQATNANTASTIVQRDASGNFSAGTITAALSGNATTATTATNLAGGGAGQIPYNTGAGATAFLAAGTAGYVLQSNGTSAPSWAAVSTPNNGTLTLAVAGTGLSGSQTFTANQASNVTFTVTSNATNANTASTIVARDASGNFSAGTITATLSGNASTATSATSATSATTATTATTANALNTGNNYQINSLGVGTAASGTAGEIRATNNITAYYSDDRLKTRLGGIENALDKICQLEGFFYEANQTAQDLGYEPVREVGVSAQQVQAVLPEVVVPAPIDERYLTVRYEKIIPLLIEAIKELRAEVKTLRVE